ncbi:MAG: acyltransferase family protein [Megasphaera sp.]|jgi:hypothetical protein|nr:acyltransferase family protein [Megasphaera sp.]
MKRIWFLDNLRTFAILAGIVCTIIADYRVFPAQTVLPASTHWIGFDVCYEGSAAILLAVLFFISGYLGASDLRIHMLQPFFQKKWKRLGWPWLFGALLLAPELAYLSYISQNGSENFIGFYLHWFWTDSFTQGPFWFLGVLILLFLCLMGAKKWHHNILQRQPAAGMTAATVLSIIILQTVLLSVALSQGGMNWFNALYVVTFQPGRLVTCILYFILGVYAFKHRWFTAAGYMPSNRWILALVITALLYVIIAPYAAILGLFIVSVQPAHTLAFLASFLSLPGLLGGIAIMNRIPHSDGKKAVLLANLSYPFYFLSAFLMENTAYFLHPLAISEGIKVILIVILSTIYGYMLCKYALWHLPCFKKH